LAVRQLDGGFDDEFGGLLDRRLNRRFNRRLDRRLDLGHGRLCFRQAACSSFCRRPQAVNSLLLFQP